MNALSAGHKVIAKCYGGRQLHGDRIPHIQEVMVINDPPHENEYVDITFWEHTVRLFPDGTYIVTDDIGWHPGI